LHMKVQNLLVARKWP